MSALLNKRLARSLWRTKLRLSAVILMVFVGVFAEHPVAAVAVGSAVALLVNFWANRTWVFRVATP